MSRPSPTASATSVSAGTIMVGNDGRYWQARTNIAGVQRWVPVTHHTTASAASTASGLLDTPPPTVSTVVHEISYKGQPWTWDPIKRKWFLTADYIKNQITHTNPSKTMAQPTTKVKNISRNKTAETRTIETSLVNKEEVFKMLALAEATGLPLLLVGPPGVAKTKTVVEYAKAWLQKDGAATGKDFMEKIYILETDEGTKSSEVKGMPDLGKLFTENQYELSAPITDAEVVIINEVDKASSNIRNALLGVMNEKFLFNGKHKLPCKWKIFVATCNEIPKEEEGNPFWDRFVLKMPVSRVSAGEMVKYFEKGARDYREKFSIGVPNKTEIDSVDVAPSKLEKYLEVGYSQCSDRTLTYVPNLARAVSYIWDISMDKALVKVASIMISNSAASELQNKLMSPEVKSLMGKVEMLWSLNDSKQIDLALGEIEGLMNGYAHAGKLDESQVAEVETSVQYILDNHPVKQREKEIESVLAEAMNEDVLSPL